MKTLNNLLKIASLSLMICLLLFSCKKQNEWLDIKSNKASVVPETIKDFQALLDNNGTMNISNVTAGIVGSDNIIIASADLDGVFESERNLYLWNKTVWVGGVSYEWNYYYRAIETANLVLEGMKKLDSSLPGYNNVIGQAYFFRAFYYYNLAQLFCKPYSKETENTDLGLPLRVSSDVNVVQQRSTLKELYDQMINDLKAALPNLNETQPYLQRPTKNAANALFSKICFVQEDYANALRFAEEVLTKKPTLIDYNNPNLVSNSFAYKFPANGIGNPEILFYAEGAGYSAPQGYLGCIGVVDQSQIDLYNANDLRKTTLYGNSNKGINYVGSYTGNFNNFFGLATNEIYLIRAESYARLGNVQLAMDDLNRLLLNRFKVGTFSSLSASNELDAINLILKERRKELPNVSTIRWDDLRRVNKDPRFQLTLTRSYNGKTFTLPPNDPRYVLPIPDQEVQISHIIQNVR